MIGGDVKHSGKDADERELADIVVEKGIGMVFKYQIMSPLRKVRGAIINYFIDKFVLRNYYKKLNINILYLYGSNIFVIFKS